MVHLTDHNHGPITAELASEDIVRGVKRRAVEELTPVPRIYQEEVTAANQRGDLNDEIAAHLPNLQGCSSSAYRARRRRLPMLPATRENIVLEGEWAQTADGHDFVLANDGGAEKLIIFGNVEGLLQVCRANSVYMDGTFYAVPTLFHQLYTVHAKAYGQMFPLLYGLLPNRTEDTYTRFTHLIQAAAAERNVQFDPDEILIDYEQAAIQAYRRVLPGCHVKGCLFHYGQCIHCCIQRIGLAAQYNAAELGNPLRRWVRRTLALPLTPPDQIDLVWQNIMDDAPVIQEADQFHNYVTNTWIGDNSRFSRNMWNHYDRLEESRTINALEGWHHKINSYIGKPHPNLWEFISFLKKEELFQRIELQRLEAGGRPNPRRLTYVRIDNRLANLKTQYERNERPLMSYVDAVSYLLRH